MSPVMGHKRSAAGEPDAQASRDSVAAAAHYECAEQLYPTGRLADAYAEMEKAVASDPDYRDAADILGYWGKELEGVRQNEHIFRERIQASPGDFESRFDLADTLYSLGRLSEAATEWSTLVELDKQGYWGKRAGKALQKKF